MREMLGRMLVGGLAAGCAVEAGVGSAGGGPAGVGGAAAAVGGGAPVGSGGAAGGGEGSPDGGGLPGPGLGGARGESGAGTGGSAGAPGVDPGPKQPKAPAPGKWIAVKKGSYLAGAPKTEACNGSANQLQHSVTLTHDFELSATEVTYAEYQVALGSAHSAASSCSDCPANLMTWHRAAEVCNAYSKHAGLTPCYVCTGSGDKSSCSEALPPYGCHGYRLPTEAEWEYAYRAGTTTPIYNGDLSICGGLDPNLDPIAWFLYNASGGAHPAGQKQPNAWGFFDMSGNVWEWSHDGYVTDRSTLPQVDPVGVNAAGLRVMRGGSYNCVPEEVRGAHRSGLPAQIAGSNVGVRCARTLD